jgi:uncharacterized membrane protein HdeD (DUF308 family)
MTDGAVAGPAGRPNSRRGVVVAVVVAVFCVVFGTVLALRPSDDTETLARMIGVGLVALAASFLVRRAGLDHSTTDRVTAGVWALVGSGALVWPDPTVHDLALVVGIALAFTGAIELVASLVAESDRRVSGIVSGVTSVLLGVAVVSWPTATTLVLAIVVGARLVVAGVLLLVEQRDRGRDPRATGRGRYRWRLAGSVIGLVIAAGLAVVSVAVNRRPTR